MRPIPLLLLRGGPGAPQPSARRRCRHSINAAAAMLVALPGAGWGVGFGIGTQYINVSPEFTEGKQHRCVQGWGVRGAWHPVLALWSESSMRCEP